MDRKIALLIEYDGSRFAGFQVQNNAPTVQGTLETALNTITGESNRIRGASRTDTGVHALGQVATFITRSEHDPGTFTAALNFHLPDDVAVREAVEPAGDIDVRHGALSRHYRYLILQRGTPSALSRGRAYQVRRVLDLGAMQAAADLLVGEHDFAGFSGRLSEQKTTVRRVLQARFTATGEWIIFDIEATAFLPQQVRRTMGVLVTVGTGEQPPTRVRALLDHPVLGAAANPLPPHALYLMHINYPPQDLAFASTSAVALETPIGPLFATSTRERA